ncbi:MAG: thiamine-phosphate kinase [Lentisphaeria bacterium]|nr:thiamine-phosphate kinase [Lentisphaeria bacterium]
MIDEIEILRRLPALLPLNGRISVGAGDDCAVINMPGKCQLLAAADQVIEKVHFLPETPPRLVGRKLMNRNLSDIAAMGGTPLTALLTVAAGEKDSRWVEELVSGAAEAGSVFDVPICGGDTAALPHDGAAASLTILGEVPRGTAVLRSGARPGDGVFVTGCIGNSFHSEHHLNFTPRLAEGAFLRPLASAMIDISDGLLLDAMRLADASGVSVMLYPEAVPLRTGAVAPGAFSDGEDYELLFTSSHDVPQMKPEKTAVITRIGQVVPRRAAPVVTRDGRPFTMENNGYVHR